MVQITLIEPPVESADSESSYRYYVGVEEKMSTDADLDHLRKRWEEDLSTRFFSGAPEQIDRKEEVSANFDLDDPWKKFGVDLRMRFYSGGFEHIDWKNEKDELSRDIDLDDLRKRCEVDLRTKCCSREFEQIDWKSSNLDAKSEKKIVQCKPEPRKEINRVHSDSLVYPASVFVPGDIIREIFLRVPQKTLPRFRSICKSWRDEIDGLSFKHARQALDIQRTRESSSFHLFDDIMRLIFFKVSVKTLSTLRCVCKNWLKIIDDSTFKTMYQMRSIESGNLESDLVMVLDMKYFDAEFDWDSYTDADGSTLTGPVYFSPSGHLFWGTPKD